jgi:hypothetical protein
MATTPVATKTVDVTVSGSDVTVTISATNYTGDAQVSCTLRGATSSAPSAPIGGGIAPATFTFANLAAGTYDVQVVCSGQTFIQEATVPQTAPFTFSFTSTHPVLAPEAPWQGKSNK